MSNRKSIVTPEEVETIVTDWTIAKVMCGPRVTGAEGMSVVVLCFEPGRGHSRHKHTESEQSIFVISGQGEQIVEVERGNPVTQTIGAGSLVYIPKGAYHSTFNTGWEPMRIVAVFSPPGPEASMRELGDTGGIGTTDLQVLAAGVAPKRV